MGGLVAVVVVGGVVYYFYGDKISDFFRNGDNQADVVFDADELEVPEPEPTPAPAPMETYQDVESHRGFGGRNSPLHDNPEYNHHFALPTNSESSTSSPISSTGSITPKASTTKVERRIFTRVYIKP